MIAQKWTIDKIAKLLESCDELHSDFLFVFVSVPKT